jgi:hypothetical protein
VDWKGEGSLSGDKENDFVMRLPSTHDCLPPFLIKDLLLMGVNIFSLRIANSFYDEFKLQPSNVEG